MTTDVNVMSSFSPLDEMIQMIYQSIYQFVVMSNVTSEKWTVHVGMVGDAGRWWRGVWQEKDVVKAVGPKPSEKLLETFVDKLMESIVGGDLYLANFSTEKDAKIQLKFGPTVELPLREIDPVETAAHATSVFLEIALQAQEHRKCRLHPSTFSAVSVPGTSNRLPSDRKAEPAITASEGSSGLAQVRPKNSGHADVEMKGSEDADEVKPSASKKEPLKKRVLPPSEGSQAQPKAPGRPAGASLANPNKKARKIKAMEFESDGD